MRAETHLQSQQKSNGNQERYVSLSLSLTLFTIMILIHSLDIVTFLKMNEMNFFMPLC